MSDAKHTEGRWVAEKWRAGIVVYADDDKTQMVAYCGTRRGAEIDKANADRIVLAHNCHDELVQAVKDLLEEIDNDPTSLAMLAAYNKAKRVLAKAKGET